MNKKIGRQTVVLSDPPVITAAVSVVGPKEGQGPLKEYFDRVLEDAMAGQKSWEQAESSIILEGMKLLLEKGGCVLEDLDYILSGDLLNQCSGSTFGLRDLKRPFFGLFGACSTMGEAMSLGAMLLDGGFGQKIAAGASSHFCSAEKQFRFPLNHGTQRPPTSTWTVTGFGGVLLEREGKGPRITHITTGRIVDMGVTDANNMGAAMAPAAVDTLLAHFRETGRTPEDYDCIVTGDLGLVGHRLVNELMQQEGVPLDDRYTDCGLLIFDSASQDTHAGGSGCACSAVTFCGKIYTDLLQGRLKRVLFMPTGALMSTTTSQQGESIPGIAHGVVLESPHI